MPVEIPSPSSLPGRPGEQADLYRCLRALAAESAAQSARIDELGRLAESQADKIRWLEGEMSRLAAIVQGVADEAHRERQHRRTEIRADVTREAAIRDVLNGKSPVVPQDGRGPDSGVEVGGAAERGTWGGVGEVGAIQQEDAR